MGGNASPQIADLALAAPEIKYISDKKNNAKGKHLFHVVRYVDDVFGVNCPDFLSICKEIYPSSLPLNDTSVSTDVCDYLDLHIAESSGSVSVSVYNKTQVFPFRVNRFVTEDSNVSARLGLDVFFGQLHRIACICSSVAIFRSQVSALLSEFKQKGHSNKSLLDKFQRFQAVYRPLCAKFNLTNKHACTRFWNSC